MKPKHTPGPWDYTPNPYPDQRYEYVCYQNGKGSIAQLERHTQNHDDWRFRQREEFEANARLIAAAPELLTALAELESEMTVNYLPTFEKWKRVPEEIKEMLKAARAAIAKAEGRDK